MAVSLKEEWGKGLAIKKKIFKKKKKIVAI